MVDKIKRADVANFIRSFKGGNFDQQMRRDGTGFFQKLQKTFVYNNTGAALEIGSPVYISGVMNELPYDDLVNEYLTSGFCLKGETYDSDYPDRPVAFALEPIKEDGIGECRIDGLTPAILTGFNDETRYAKVNENTELLAQGDASDYQIIGVSDENENGKRFAFVKPKAPAGQWNCWIVNPYDQPIMPGPVVIGGGYYRNFSTLAEAYQDYTDRGLVITPIVPSWGWWDNDGWNGPDDPRGAFRPYYVNAENTEISIAFVLEEIPARQSDDGTRFGFDGASFGKGYAPEAVAGFVVPNTTGNSTAYPSGYCRLDVDGFHPGYNFFTGDYVTRDVLVKNNQEYTYFDRKYWTYESDLDNPSTLEDPWHEVPDMPNANFENEYGQPPGYIASYDKSKNYDDVQDIVLDYDLFDGAKDQNVETRTGYWGFGVLTRYKRPQALIGKFTGSSTSHSAGFHNVNIPLPNTMRVSSALCYLPSSNMGEGHWCLVVPSEIRRKSTRKMVDGIITAIFDHDPSNEILFTLKGRGVS
ncbi:MAG: hypothetical protein IKE69_01780 [Thermoguttaceae bacterium]|nr:hypothetical protein [Thermoguttaceae bacterium]